MPEQADKPLWDVAVWECPSFLFSIFTGSGKGNVLRLRWNRIGFQKSVVPFFAKEMKWTRDLYAEGDENCPDSPKRKKQEYVFFCNNRPVGDSRTAFKKALKHAYC